MNNDIDEQEYKEQIDDTEYYKKQIDELQARIDETLKICDEVLMRGYDIDDGEYDKGEYDIAFAIYKAIRGEK